MPLTRRGLLRNALATAAFAAGAGGIEFARSVEKLIEQHETWQEASLPNGDFFARHAADLSRLNLGGSFAPEQWYRRNRDREPRFALDLAVRELGIKQMRLGLRWDRIDDGKTVQLRNYAPYLDYCFANGVEVCLNVGPVRVFRWPEEHVPGAVLDSLASVPAHGAYVSLSDPLAGAALDYSEKLMALLQAEYGPALQGVGIAQLENEPYYLTGLHPWRMRNDYLQAVAARLREALPGADLMVTSAGRLNLEAVRLLFQELLSRDPALRGHLVSGFDFHYRTPNRAAAPLISYFDQVSYARPFSASIERHIWDSRDIGFRIEVSEGQMEPFGQFEQPGNSVRDFRYMLLRCLGKVLDPQRPALVRLWGIEELTQRMIHGALTDDHRAIIEVIRHVNQPDDPRTSQPVSASLKPDNILAERSRDNPGRR